MVSVTPNNEHDQTALLPPELPKTIQTMLSATRKRRLRVMQELQG
jgi:hypothetical protein